MTIGDSEPCLLTRPDILCKDGFCFSVQACRGVCCTPKVNDLDGNYTAVEVALISGEEELLANQMKIIDNGNREEYYPNMPIEIVDAIIEKHGGITRKLKHTKRDINKIKVLKKY